MELKSQEMRKLAPELDPLRIGTGWKREDLSKPQIFIESTYGDSHPGSGHLNILVEEVRKGVAQAGGFGARYYVTDICDGESQGTDGINFSLASREMIANMIEIQGNATVSDAGVYLASCDKGMPGNLMGLARVNIPSVVVPGGTMNAGPEMLTLEQLGMYSAKYQRGEIDEEKLDWAKCNACPSCGACSFIGTLLFSAFASLLLSQWSVFDCMAVGSGFAYYSLSSILITQFKEASVGLQLATELGTIALLANIFREMMALLGTPLIRKYFGKLAPISAAGVNSMDVLLPSITHYSGKDMIPVAIFHGILIDMSVPFFVSLFCSL